jgi:hypothetical protein
VAATNDTTKTQALDGIYAAALPPAAAWHDDHALVDIIIQ